MSKSVYSIVLAILLVVCLAPLSAHADVKTGLVGYWPLDGDATDAGGNGHDGTLVGDVRPVPDRYNVADAALSFPGQADAYVDLGDPEQLQITGAMTVTAWVFLNGTNLNSGRIITKQDAAGGGSWGLGIDADGDGVANALTFSVTRGAADVVSVVDAESLPTDQWVHVTGIYVDGFQHAANTVDIPAQQVGDDGTTVSIGALPEGADCGWDGIIDEVRLYDRVVSQVEIWQIMRANVGCSLDPNPSNGATGVPADVTLSWTAGLFARTHDLYLGTVYSDVNDATRTDPRGVLLSQGRTLTKYYVADTDFQYGQTYYWRVDEVNAFDAAFYKGNVWSFTVELYAPALENVVASSSAISNDGQSPANTVNGAGLNGDDEHSVVPEDMWLGVPSSDEPLWIQYQFDSVCKLQQMLVWNYNAPSESTDGFGLKDVRIEYSTNGSEWNVLKDVELAQATGADGYAANNTISLGGISAKFVRLLVQSNWGGAQYGLSEVRFFHVPMRARAPQPADGETGVDVELILGWSAGRQVSSHDVHFSTSAPLVATGAALVGSVTTNQYVLASLDYGARYFWKIDEHDATAGSVWQGDIWTFSTREYTMFDDFESYNDDARRVYEIWKDGYNNGTGAIVGYMEAPFAEKHIVHGGGQSMPFEYYNAEAPFYSEAARFIGTNNNWLGHDADTLHLFVRGEAGNDPGMLYLGLQDTTGHIEVVTHPDPTIVTSTTWQEWVIPYSDLEGVRMSSLDKMILGVGDRDNPTLGGSGRIYIDDIGYGHPVGGSTPVRR
jgi:hypothetical protein